LGILKGRDISGALGTNAKPISKGNIKKHGVG
jgi:hypothetical protein